MASRAPRPGAAARLQLALLIVLGAGRGALRWARRGEVRRKATRDAAVLLRGTSREGQKRRVGLGIVVEQAVQWTLFPHYRLLSTAPLRGLEHLDAAEAKGRGVVMVTTHCGWVQALLWCLTHAGRPFTVVSGQWLVRSERPTDIRQMPMVNDAIAHGAHHLIAGSGAFDKLSAAVEARGRALMAIDMPGSLELTYFGKPAKVGQGTYRIAWNHQAPLVPAAIKRRGLHLEVELLPALDPTSYSSVEELAQDVTDVIGATALADASQYMPRNIAILWPGGDAANSRPNREAWAATQSDPS